jgi:hypothetical protein
VPGIFHSPDLFAPGQPLISAVRAMASGGARRGSCENTSSPVTHAHTPHLPGPFPYLSASRSQHGWRAAQVCLIAAVAMVRWLALQWCRRHRGPLRLSSQRCTILTVVPTTPSCRVVRRLLPSPSSLTEPRRRLCWVARWGRSRERTRWLRMRCACDTVRMRPCSDTVCD